MMKISFSKGYFLQILVNPKKRTAFIHAADISQQYFVSKNVFKGFEQMKTRQVKYLIYLVQLTVAANGNNLIVGLKGSECLIF